METPTLVMNQQPTDYTRPVSHRYDPHTSPPGVPPALRDPDPRPPGDGWAGFPRREAVSAEVRNQIARRVVDANFEHARAAWARRRSDPIGPHVTIYLYSSGSELRLAYRVFLAADEPSLPHLLHELVPHVRHQLAAGLDVRDAQCTVVEDGMRPDPYCLRPADLHLRPATYLGVAVSSLDTPAGSWAQVCRTATSEVSIPGRCYVWLVDDTVVVIDRLARDQFGRVTVYANEPVRASLGEVGHPVTAVAELAIPQRQTIADPDVLTWLRELHHTVLAGNRGGGGHVR